MAIDFKILGGPDEDNAVLATVDTGQQISKLLFDCGEGVLDGVPFGETLGLHHVLFSHYHMDHIAGFDSFFRRHFDRTSLPNHLWGPPGTGAIMGHRFLGYCWNLVEDRAVAWHCHDIFPDHVSAVRYELSESFATAHPERSLRRRHTEILSGPGFRVDAVTLQHGIDSIGYVIRESERVNVDPAKLAASGLTPGPWLHQLRQAAEDAPEDLHIDGSRYAAAALRDDLLVCTPGDSLAYFTDFFADEAEITRLAKALHGVGTLICECQYRECDSALAAKNHHMTTAKVGALAAAAGAGRLILIHLSDRYLAPERPALLEEVKSVFPRVQFPIEWEMP